MAKLTKPPVQLTNAAAHAVTVHKDPSPIRIRSIDELGADLFSHLPKTEREAQVLALKKGVAV